MGNLYRFVEPVVLYLLLATGQSYGYDLAGLLNKHALTDSEIERAALYRTLRQLEDNGYVISEWDTSQPGPARRLYRLTEDGVVHLKEWITVLGHLHSSLGKFVQDACALVKEKG